MSCVGAWFRSEPLTVVSTQAHVNDSQLAFISFSVLLDPTLKIRANECDKTPGIVVCCIVCGLLYVISERDANIQKLVFRLKWSEAITIAVVLVL